MNIQTKSMLQLAIAMAIFGSIGFFTVQTGIPALELVFVRCICATIILSALWILTKSYASEQYTKKNIPQTMLCGVFLVLNWVFLFKAFEQLSISISITIYNLAPIFLLLIASLLLKERISFIGVIATACCFLGSILIIGMEHLTSIHDFLSTGFIWAFLSAICYALTMLTSKTITNLSSYSLTFIQTTVGIIILAPFCDFSVFLNLTTENWFYIIATGVIHTGVVYYLFFNAVRSLSTTIVSVLVFIDPVVAIVLDIFLLDFVPSSLQWLGMLIIFVSIVATLFINDQKRLEQ